MDERERESNGASLRGTTQHAADKNPIFQLNPEQQRPVLRHLSQSVTNGRFFVSDNLPGVASRCVWNTAVLSSIDPYRVLSLLLQLGLNKVTSIIQTSVISVAATAAPVTLAPHTVRQWASLMVAHPSSIAASDWLKVWLANVIDVLIGPHAGGLYSRLFGCTGTMNYSVEATGAKLC